MNDRVVGTRNQELRLHWTFDALFVIIIYMMQLFIILQKVWLWWIKFWAGDLLAMGEFATE